jgi:hypothetical protein
MASIKTEVRNVRTTRFMANLLPKPQTALDAEVKAISRRAVRPVESAAGDVRYGSLADIGGQISDVRLLPKADMLSGDIDVC